MFPIVVREYPKIMEEKNIVNIQKRASLSFYGVMSPYPMVDIVITAQYRE
jgi:hypothetical protein